MAIYNGPPRGGTRGGRDQFSWDNVKSDKDREFYLGHSVKAPTGRWQKGKDILWYTREKAGSNGAAMTELEAIKAREEELMAQALGLKPKSTVPAARSKPLEKHELAALLKKDEDDTAPAAGAAAGLFDEDRMKGLGFGRMAVVGSEGGREVLGAEGIEEGVLPSPPRPPTTLSGADLKILTKAMKKQSKQEKRSKDKKSKDKKKSKKHKKRRSSSIDSSCREDNQLDVAQPAKRARHDSDADDDEGRVHHPHVEDMHHRHGDRNQQASRGDNKEEVREGYSRGVHDGHRERRHEGTKERVDEGNRERRHEGNKERVDVGDKERGNDWHRAKGSRQLDERGTGARHRRRHDSDDDDNMLTSEGLQRRNEAVKGQDTSRNEAARSARDRHGDESRAEGFARHTYASEDNHERAYRQQVRHRH